MNEPANSASTAQHNPEVADATAIGIEPTEVAITVRLASRPQ